MTGYQALIRALLDAEGARPPRRPQHRGLCHRLSRLALGRPRPADDARRPHIWPPHDVKFQPGINEELAATALWGTQQAELRGEGKFDGVFGMWYGKGPGVDRSGDVFRHANLAGTAKNGGVLALMGDDHTAESSTTAHQSEFHFVDVMMPILNPAGVQEIIDYALYGWAMSRFTGTWTALKCMHETVEFDRRGRRQPRSRQDRHAGRFPACRRAGSISAWSTPSSARKRACTISSATPCSPSCAPTSSTRSSPRAAATPKIGIITTGKAYLDVRQAFDELGIDEIKCNDLGLRLFKIACPWPISRQELAEFAQGLDLIIVVEEKRSLIEVQVREELYGTQNQPVCIGKKDEQGNWLFPVKGALDPNDVAICIGERLLRYRRQRGTGRQCRAAEGRAARARAKPPTSRSAFLISARAARTTPRRACRTAAAPMPASAATTWRSGWTARRSASPRWAARAPTGSARRRSPKRGHVFQNLGDGTYNHSGYLAIRAAIASGVTMTYKILFNDAVAMTGGQANEGGLNVPQIARQVAAEGAKRVVVVTDEPWKYPKDTDWPRGLTVHHRDELDAVQRDLATVPGVSILIYDQTCAAEKRRRRKRGSFPDPHKRVVINDLVCEGCGDCGVKSNCVSVQPLMTEWGRKRTIDQASCNKDYSCVKGFCPSFVTVHGAKLKHGEGVAEPADWPALPEPEPAARQSSLRHHRHRRRRHRRRHHRRHSRHGRASGRQGVRRHRHGGLGAEGRRGLQPYPHRQYTSTTSTPSASPPAAPIWCIGGDIAVVGSKKVLSAIKHGGTRVLVNTFEFLPGDFTRDADYSLPTARLKRAVIGAAGP